MGRKVFTGPLSGRKGIGRTVGDRECAAAGQQFEEEH
jgi:hypothetical protein